MASFALLQQGLSPGYRLRLSEGSINPIQTKKSCCCSCNSASAKVHAVYQERCAIQEAISQVYNSPPIKDCEAACGLFTALNKRSRSISRITSGLLGWLLSLFRSRKVTLQLKLLNHEYGLLKNALVEKGYLTNSIFSTALKIAPCQNDALLLKRLKQEVPELFLPELPEKIDFGLSPNNQIPRLPFLIEVLPNKGYLVNFPPYLGNCDAPPIQVRLTSFKQLIEANRKYNTQKMFEQEKRKHGASDALLSNWKFATEKNFKVVRNQFEYSIQFKLGQRTIETHLRLGRGIRETVTLPCEASLSEFTARLADPNHLLHKNLAFLNLKQSEKIFACAGIPCHALYLDDAGYGIGLSNNPDQGLRTFFAPDLMGRECVFLGEYSVLENDISEKLNLDIAKRAAGLGS